MRRDYKHVPRARERGRRGSPPWLWAIGGFGLGLFVAFMLYLRFGAPPLPAVVSPPPAPSAAATPPSARPAPERATAPVEAAPAKPRFEFYTILPEMDVPVPESGPRPAGETYVLQVGSFKTHEEADRLKASLTLLGLQASIQTVTVDGKATWHRVRVGPYQDMAKVNEARRRLKEQSLDAVLLKGKT
jgi:cell division protein FtsN